MRWRTRSGNAAYACSDRPGQGAVLKKNPKQDRYGYHSLKLQIMARGVNGTQTDDVHRNAPYGALAWADARGSVISSLPALDRSESDAVDCPLCGATGMASAKRIAHLGFDQRLPRTAPGRP